MKKDDISRLLERYLSARQSDKEPYFDADEIEELLNSFEETDDFTYYEEVLNLGLKLHPGSSDLQIKHCKQLVFNEEYERALEKIDTLTDGDNQELELLRLECYCSLDQYGKVIQYVEELFENQFEYLELIFEYLTPILNDLEMFSEARDFIDRGLQLFPDSQILKDELCFIRENEGDIEGAIELYNELIDKNPYSFEYWFSLGRLYSIVGEYEKAIEAFDFALTCDESNNELRILKAYCLYMNDSYRKAIEVYMELESFELIWDQVKSLVAECHLKLGEYREAYSLLIEIIQKGKVMADPTVYVNLATCCVESENEAEAIEWLHKGLVLFPNNTKILSMLAIHYVSKGDKEKGALYMGRLTGAFEIEAVYDELKEELSDYEHAAFNLSKIDKEMKAFKAIANTDPTSQEATLYNAIQYFFRGDSDKFMKYYLQFDEEHIQQFKELIKKAGTLDSVAEDSHLADSISLVPPETLINEYLKNKENNN